MHVAIQDALSFSPRMLSAQIKPSYSHATRTWALNLAKNQTYKKCVRNFSFDGGKGGYSLTTSQRALKEFNCGSPLLSRLVSNGTFLAGLSFTYVITNGDVKKEDGGIVCLFWAQLLGKLSWQILNTPSSAVAIEIIGIFFQLKGLRVLATASIFIISVTRAMLKYTIGGGFIKLTSV